MTEFLANAGRIFEAARRAGRTVSFQELAIVITHSSNIHVVDAAGWNSAGLLEEYGAKAVYRVLRSQGKIRVQATAPWGTCMLEADEFPAPHLRDVPFAGTSKFGKCQPMISPAGDPNYV